MHHTCINLGSYVLLGSHVLEGTQFCFYCSQSRHKCIPSWCPQIDYSVLFFPPPLHSKLNIRMICHPPGAFILLPLCGSCDRHGHFPWSLPWRRFHHAILQTAVGKTCHTGWPWECWPWTSPQSLLDVVSLKRPGMGGGGVGGDVVKNKIRVMVLCS